MDRLKQSPRWLHKGSACLLLLLAGCQSTDIPPIAKSLDQTVLLADEARLWLRCEEEQAVLDGSGYLNLDAEATRYLENLVRHLAPETLPNQQSWKVRLLNDPTLNAFAYPNGVIYVHTGLLARVENEAQLAGIIGHELSHTLLRHGVRQKRETENALTAMATFSSATAGVGSLLGLVGGLSAISGYSRDLEREADQAGFKRLVDCGYDPSEAPKVFRILEAEAKRSKIKEPYFFGSHPRLKERIETFDTLVAALPAKDRKGLVEAERFLAIRHKILLVNARAALTAGDPDFAISCTEHFLTRAPESDEAHLLHAESLRRRGNGKDFEDAAAELLTLCARPDAPAIAFRELGLAYLKGGKKAEATSALKDYLTRSPDAKDRSLIESLL